MPPTGSSALRNSPPAASRAPLFAPAAGTSHINGGARPESPQPPRALALHRSGSASRKRPASPSSPAATPSPPANDSQTGSSPRLQLTNAPSCAPSAPFHSPPIRRRTQKIQSPALRHNSTLPLRAPLPIPPLAAISRSNSVQAQPSAAKFLPDDDSPPADKTQSRPTGSAPPESTAPFETLQNFPAAMASWGILASRIPRLPWFAAPTALSRRIPCAASSALLAIQSS